MIDGKTIFQRISRRVQNFALLLLHVAFGAWSLLSLGLFIAFVGCWTGGVGTVNTILLHFGYDYNHNVNIMMRATTTFVYWTEGGILHREHFSIAARGKISSGRGRVPVSL
jgi:hypothetical protein